MKLLPAIIWGHEGGKQGAITVIWFRKAQIFIMNAAIIPARGGSKRIPGKNIRPFCGKPLLAYSIEVAQQAGVFDRIIVSTDSPEIMQVARNYGAETPFVRPAELCDDFTGTGAVIKHAVQWLQRQVTAIEYVCCIYATAPMLQVEYLRRGFTILTERNASYVFSVTSYPFPILRSLRILPEGGVEPIFREHIGKRSQDLEEAYHDAGQFYWGKAAAFLEGRPVFAPDAHALILPRSLVQDIDTEEDWQQAELLFRAFQIQTKTCFQ